jgi:hypothetical protein
MKHQVRATSVVARDMRSKYARAGGKNSKLKIAGLDWKYDTGLVGCPF